MFWSTDSTVNPYVGNFNLKVFNDTNGVLGANLSGDLLSDLDRVIRYECKV